MVGPPEDIHVSLHRAFAAGCSHVHLLAAADVVDAHLHPGDVLRHTPNDLK